MNTSFTALARRLFQRVAGLDPARLVLLGYASYIVLGWAALCLPWSVHAGVPATWLDHLFTATSAVSTTGLATVGTATTYTGFGEFVVLLLIQFGGLGYMTISSCLLLAVSGRLEPWRERVGAASLALPADFNVKQFLKLTVGYTLAIEAAGAYFLYPSFRDAGAEAPVWQAVFHSVSAFCTAGFGLYGDSFESFRTDTFLNGTIIALSYRGAVGFIVVHDVWLSLAGRKLRVTFTTKVILAATAAVSVVGTVLLALDEPLLQAMPAGERWLAAWFQVMTASTTVGFNTVPIGALSTSSLFLLVVVMIIGASPAGTGGGLKTTTFTALWAVGMSVLRKRERPTFIGREIPVARIRMAVAQALFYGLTLGAGIYALALVQPDGNLADQMFECASALGTVGLSRGITGVLNEAGKLVVVALMFAGRVGPLGLGTVFFRPRETQPAPEEDVVM